MNMFELKAEINDALEAYMQGIDTYVDTETGEILPLKDYIDDLNEQKDEKITNVALFILNRKAMLDSLEKQKKVFMDKIAREKKKIEDASEWLREATDEKKFEDEDGRFTISYRKTESIQIDDGADLPEEYVTTKIETKPDKVALKKAIKDGQEIAGVSLVSKMSMSVK